MHNLVRRYLLFSVGACHQLFWDCFHHQECTGNISDFQRTLCAQFAVSSAELWRMELCHEHGLHCHADSHFKEEI